MIWINLVRFIPYYIYFKVIFIFWLILTQGLFSHCFYLFVCLFLFFRESKREGEKYRERNNERDTLFGCLLHMPDQSWDCAFNWDTCPWQESNQGPFSLWGTALSFEPNWIGLKVIFKTVFSAFATNALNSHSSNTQKKFKRLFYARHTSMWGLIIHTESCTYLIQVLKGRWLMGQY